MGLKFKRNTYCTQSRVTSATNGETDKHTQHLCRLGIDDSYMLLDETFESLVVKITTNYFFGLPPEILTYPLFKKKKSSFFFSSFFFFLFLVFFLGGGGVGRGGSFFSFRAVFHSKVTCCLCCTVL